jgi:sodium transport system permease protein
MYYQNMISGWMKRSGRDGPDSVDSFVVFMLALAWATFAGPPLQKALGAWSVAAFTSGFFLIPAGIAIVCGFRMPAAFRLKLPSARHAAAGMILATGMLLAVIVSSAAISILFPNLPVSGKTFRTNVNDPDLFRLIVSVALLPAICEETLFRGFILSGLDRGSRRMGPVVLCGILFGLLHMDPVQIPFTAAVGIGLSWMALESGSIVVPFIMHAFHNLALLALARFGLPLLAGMNDGRGPFRPLLLWSALAAVSLLAAFSIVAGFRLAKRHFRSPS